jgi:ELWxxDGT repeat protein
MVKDLTPGPTNNTSADQHMMNLSSVNGKLFFMATAETPSSNIWMSDGTTAGTQQVTFDDMYLRYFQTFHEINGAAYFFAMDMNTGNRNLSKVDMSGNISVVRSDLPWDDTFNMIDWVRIEEQYFFISEGYYWRTDGTTHGTSRLRTLCCPGGSYPSTLTDVNGTLYFRTIKTNEIWKSNGTAETTELILDEAQATDMVGLHNLVLMSARVSDDIGSYQTLWVTDGTAEGSMKLSETARYPTDLTASLNQVYFSAQTSESGYELWKSDGTPEGTNMVKDISTGATSSDPGRFVAIGDKMFFVAHSPEFGHELWITDGTEPGTNIVRNIGTGSESSGPFSLTEFNGSLYFFATDGPFGVNGYELWKSDGTEANTTMVTDIRPSDVMEEGQYDVRNMVATDSWLFFGAINVDGQHSVWKSNGTGTGTTQLLAYETPTEYLPLMLASTGTNAFFIRQFETWTELWVTDGSAVTEVKTLQNEEFQSVLTVKGSTIYFITTSTESSLYGTNYLWRSDGTPLGTYRIRFDGQPMELQSSGPYVYLSGRSDKEGAELFIIEEATHPSSQVRLAVAEEAIPAVDGIVQSYPNPFNSSVAVTVSGDANATFGLEVLNINGARVMQDEFSCNVEHQVGSSSWPAGMYVLKIKTQSQMITKKVVKLGN